MAPAAVIDAGSTAWVPAGAALVMVMAPGLALFYGGMVRSKAVLNTMMLTFVCLGVVGVVWVLYGYSLAFDTDAGAGLIGDGLLAGGGFGLLGKQAVAIVATLGWSFVATVVLAWILQRTIGLRVDPEVEYGGIDEAEHAESGYELSSMSSSLSSGAGRTTGTPTGTTGMTRTTEGER